MKKQEFIDLLYANGWKATNDAQHELISGLFEEWHPKDTKIERLEEEIELIERRMNDIAGELEKFLLGKGSAMSTAAIAGAFVRGEYDK